MKSCGNCGFESEMCDFGFCPRCGSELFERIKAPWPIEPEDMAENSLRIAPQLSEGFGRTYGYEVLV